MSGGMIKVNVSGKADVVMTTKGDIVTYSTERVRKAVGNNSQILVCVIIILVSVSSSRITN